MSALSFLKTLAMTDTEAIYYMMYPNAFYMNGNFHVFEDARSIYTYDVGRDTWVATDMPKVSHYQDFWSFVVLPENSTLTCP